MSGIQTAKHQPRKDSVLPGGLSAKAVRLLRKVRKDEIIDELHTGVGSGLVLTHSRLLLIQGGLMWRDKPSEGVNYKDIRTMEYHASDLTCVTVRLRMHNPAEIKYATIALDRWPLAAKLLSRAAELAGIAFSEQEVSQRIQEGVAQLQQVMAADKENRNLAIAAEEERRQRELAIHRSAVESQVQQAPLLLSAKDMSLLYGPYSLNARNQPTELKSTVGVVYLSGVPALDKYFGDASRTSNKHLEELDRTVAVVDRPHALSLVVTPILLKELHAPFRHDRVTRIDIVEDARNAIVRAESGLGGAVVGGLLFGGAGAVVGAVTQKGNRELVGSCVVVIEYLPEYASARDAKTSAMLAVRRDQLELVNRYFRNIYGSRVHVEDRYSMSLQSLPGSTAPALEALQAGTSLTAEIEKLGDLRDRGLLTNEEFNAAKLKLLR